MQHAVEQSGRTGLKIFLSLAILFQLFCTVLAPNQNAYLRARFTNVIDPYVGLLGIGSTWSFFAPEPGPPPIYIEYELYDKQGTAIEKGSWPQRGESFLFQDRALRRGAAAQFMLLHPEYAAPMLIPYLCQANPGVESVRLWSVVYRLPSMSEVSEGKQKVGDELSADRKAITLDFCQGFK